MTKKPGFDNDRYLARQTEAILERVERFHNKLYLEFGGKEKLKDQADLMLCIYSGGGSAVNYNRDVEVFSSKNLFVH